MASPVPADTGDTDTADTADTDAAAAALVRRVLDALLREDHLGVCSRGWAAAAPIAHDHAAWWSAPLPGGRTLHLPVRPDGFLAERAVADALVVVTEPDGAVHAGGSVDDLLAALAPHDDPEAEAGWADFARECHQALAVVRRHERLRPWLLGRLAARTPTGPRGLLAAEALGAVRDHPVHPTGRCRWDMSDDEQARYAPEHLPEFDLCWTVVPLADLETAAGFPAALPPWWPRPADLGHPGADARDGGAHVALPVHPLSAERGAVPVDGLPRVRVAPTLSTRTVVVLDDPTAHVKLPLPTATLGRRNRRTIKPSTLVDGERVAGLLAAVLEREPALAAGVLLADESCWATRDDALGTLLRRLPDTGDDLLVTVAALGAPDPHRPGTTLLDRFAAARGEDAVTWFDRYLRVLLDWHVALGVRYGVVLEAHQQNVTVAGSAGGGIRLVAKDNDSGRIDTGHLARALGVGAGDLGPGELGPGDFRDPRLADGGPDALADMLTTITLHLCAAAPLTELAGDDRARRRTLFDLLRTRLDEALTRWSDPSDPAAAAAEAAVRARVLDAEHLPGKAMVTAGTLLPKERLGIADVNKHYLRTGPNYLRDRG